MRLNHIVIKSGPEFFRAIMMVRNGSKMLKDVVRVRNAKSFSVLIVYSIYLNYLLTITN